MDITERTPLIQSELRDSNTNINFVYISRKWSKLLIITTLLDFTVHIIIYLLSFLNEARNDLILIKNELIVFKFYDYLILSSLRFILLFLFCYIKKFSKFHIPVVVTFLTIVYITMDNYFSDTRNNIFRFLLITSSFLFSWCELIIYIIAIYKYGSNYWYRISIQSFQFPYTNLNIFTERSTNSRESEQNSESNDVQIDIETDNNDDLTLNNSETSRTLQGSSINNENYIISQIEPTIEEGTTSTHTKHITIDSNFQFYSFSKKNTTNSNNNSNHRDNNNHNILNFFKNNNTTHTINHNHNNNINYNYYYNNNDDIASTSTKPEKIIKHRVSKSIDIKRPKKDADNFSPVSEGTSSVKCNTLPNHLSLKSFSPFSPFIDDNNNNNLFVNNKESKPNKSDTIFTNENENNNNNNNNNNKTKKHYIDKQLPIVMFENFKKDNNNKKSEEEEIIQKIIEEIELFYDHKMKNKIWGNDITEAENIIKSDENYKEKPYMIMQLIQIYVIKMVIDGSMDFKYLLRLLKTAEKSVMELLTRKSHKLYNKNYSISSLCNTQNGDSLPISENTSISSIFSNVTSISNLVDYDNEDDNPGSPSLDKEKSAFQKVKSFYDSLFFKNCEIFYAEIILIRGFIEIVIGKEIRGVIHIRKAWKLYNIFQTENYMTKSGSNEKETYLLSATKYSAMFGIGFAHLFSFLLNKNSLQTINLTPNIDEGKKTFENIIQVNEFKSPIAALLLIINHLYFSKCKRAEKACQSIKKHFPNSIVFSYICNICLLKQYEFSKIPKEINANSLFECDQEKFIKYLGPFFNNKVINPLLNQNWEETLKNLKDYSNLVDSKNLKLRNKDYCEHEYNIGKCIKINTPSLAPDNKLCFYCLFQPSVIPVTKIEQNIYKWCCLQMLLFLYKKKLKSLKNKKIKNKGKEKEKESNIDSTEGNSIIEISGSIDIDNHSSTSSIESNDESEFNPELRTNKEKYKELKDEFRKFNDIFINQCKEYKKFTESLNSNENNSEISNNTYISISCQLDPIILYIASHIDNKNVHLNNSNTSILSKSSPLINIICLLFVIHYASTSEMRDLLVKLFPTLNSNLYNTLMNPPVHINTQYIIKCLNSF